MATTNATVEQMYDNIGFDRVRNIKEADFIQFNGGADVFPMMYNQRPYEFKTYGYDLARDLAEENLYHQAMDLEIAKIGICRGGQFLHVMNGGSLWQDVNNHLGDHWAKFLTPSGEVEFRVTSTHHQMMRPDSKEEFSILGVAPGLSTYKVSFDTKHNTVFTVQGDILDIEALYYPNTNTFCFQPHPEYVLKDEDQSRMTMRQFFIDTIREII
jgi:gamma-glutamyl-gamma-aminobutyrate hydrolase PuuD